MLPYTIFDLESDNLYNKVTKIYCLSYREFSSQGKELERGTLVTHGSIKEYLARGTILIGHNVVRYDVPVLEKILGIKVSNRLIDTLALSWYLYPFRKSHGLEKWGKTLKVKKVEIDDWENLSLEQYIHRCEVDVEINTRLFSKQMGYLQEIYEDNESLDAIIKYLTWKMDCLWQQELHGIPLDKHLCATTRVQLEEVIEQKRSQLIEAMPPHLGNVERSRYKKMYKKDGTISKLGQQWLDYVEENNLPLDTEEVREAPNPNSDKQLKTWLYELGWEPQTWEPNDKGVEIEKVSLPFGGGLCPSVKELYKVEPRLEALDGLYVAVHRLSILKAYEKYVDDEGKIRSVAHGFTNTLRLRHGSPIVNLPKPSKEWGKEVRGCLRVPNVRDRYLMCGSDISGLEDSTKRHFMYFFDPEYVEEMSAPDFDSHLDIGIFIGLITQEESDFYKEYKKLKHGDPRLGDQTMKLKYEKLGEERHDSKTTNFAGVYGIGPPKLARQLNKSIEEATKILEGYWTRNWSVKAVAESTRTKLVKGQMWLLNPISGFWMFLKEIKDKFSTLNQSSGVYVFDMWLREVRKRLDPLGVPILMQYHDELMFIADRHLREICDRHLEEAMEAVNAKLNLNVTIRIDTQWGLSYNQCH